MTSLNSAINNVNLFNNMSFDRAGGILNDCLDTSKLPPEVIDSVKTYTKALSDVLNAGLDDLLCNNLLQNTVNQISSVKNPVETLETATEQYIVDPLFDTVEELQIAIENGIASSNTITTNDWLKTYTFKAENENSISAAVYFGSGNLNAQTVNINLKCNIIKDELNRIYTGSLLVSIQNLHCGINDGQTPTTDGTNAIPDISRINFEFPINFTTNSNIKTIKKTIEIGYQLAGSNVANSRVSLDSIIVISNIQSVPEFSITLTNLKFINSWTIISEGLNSEQKAEIRAIAKSTLDNAKTTAKNMLKSDFMSSSLATVSLGETMNKFKSTYPALSVMSTEIITSSIADAMDGNAIKIANASDDSVINDIFTSTVATSITTNSINMALDNVGMSGLNISEDCTAQLLGKAAGALSSIPGVSETAGAINNTMGNIQTGINNAILGINNALEEIVDYIPFDVALAIAGTALSKINAVFGDKLMSLECLTSINDTFDVCSDQLADLSAISAELGANKLKNISNVVKNPINKVTAATSNV